MPELIETKDLTKTYTLGEVTVNALQEVTVTIDRGSFVAIMGASGSGKSTLMNLLGCLDRPTSGRYLLDEIPVEGLDGDQLAEIRNEKIGFVFQNFSLLPRIVRRDPRCRRASSARPGFDPERKRFCPERSMILSTV
jgi:putative ABC transport system ATP-binding protein